MLHVSEVVRVDVLAVLLVVAVVGREVGGADHGEQTSAAAVASTTSAWTSTTAARVFAAGITPTGNSAVLAFSSVVLASGIAILGSSTAFAHLRGNLHVGEVDASDLVDGSGVALARTDGIQVVGVVNQICNCRQIRSLHIWRQRVELRRARLVAVPQIHRQRHAQLLRQQFAELDGAVGVQALHGLPLAFLNTLLKSTPARHRHVGGHTHVRQVRQRRVGLGHRCPTAFLVEAREAQFVHPHFSAFGLAVVAGPQWLLQILVWVSDADHHRDDVRQSGVSLHGKSLAFVHHRVHARG